MRFLLCARCFDVTPRTRIMHAIGKFDDQHAHVTTHRDHHLANGFGLCGITIFHLGKLGDTINQTSHGVSEFRTTLVKRVVGVFNCIVQQAGGHDQRPHAKIRKNLRHSQRMDNVRLTRFASL